jgi:hypothetical protein
MLSVLCALSVALVPMTSYIGQATSISYQALSGVESDGLNRYLLGPGPVPKIRAHHKHWYNNTATFKKYENVIMEHLWLSLLLIFYLAIP